jgi:hypothetical protein
LADKIVTLTLTLSREDTQALYDNSAANAEEWEATEGERIPWLDNVVTALKAALAAPPADSLDQAIKECEANGWRWGVQIHFTHLPEIRLVATVRVFFNGRDGAKAWEAIDRFGDTPLKALRAAMAAAAQGAQE